MYSAVVSMLGVIYFFEYFFDTLMDVEDHYLFM